MTTRTYRFTGDIRTTFVSLANEDGSTVEVDPGGTFTTDTPEPVDHPALELVADAAKPDKPTVAAKADKAAGEPSPVPDVAGRDLTAAPAA